MSMSLPATKPTPSASLYVGDLLSTVAEANLFEIFSNVGLITSIRVCRDHLTKRSLGYAYVNFNQVKDAERALDTLNNTPIKGKPCRIMWCQRDPSVRKSGVGNIFIKNLDPSVGHKELYDTFSDFGNILSCKVVLDENGNSKGFGFVHFEKEDSAVRAIQLVNDKIINNRKVYVGKFESKKERNLQKESSWTNVYIKELSPDISEDDLTNSFSRYGKITSTVIMKNEDGTSKGFGFVNFDVHEDAVKASNELNNSPMGKEQKRIICCRAQKKLERLNELKNKYKIIKMEQFSKYNGVNLYIKYLDDDIKEEQLRKEFSAFGTIRSLRIVTDENQLSRGFGFICFESPEAAQRAIAEMNNRPLSGSSKPLYVTFHEPKEIRRQKLAQEQLQRKQNVRPNLLQPVYPPAGYTYPTTGAPQYMYPPQLIRQPPSRSYPYPTPANQNPMSYAVTGQPPTRSQGRNPASSAPRPRNTMGSGNRRPVPQQTVMSVDQLAAHSPEQQRLLIGEKLWAAIVKREPERAGKITGMLLDSGLNIEDLVGLLDSDALLNEKIDEAVHVLNNYSNTQSM